MKKSPSSSFSPAAAILTGGLLFTGPACAAVIFSEGFEGGPGAGNAFSMPIYTYAQNYTQPNPGAGFNYGTGPSAALATLGGGTYTLLTGGISAPQVDSGSISYDFSAQFSSYRTQGDHSEMQVQFLDGANAPVGSLITFGGAAVVNSLARGPNGSYPDAAAWAADTRTGIVPAGARSLSVQILFTRLAGNACDGYVDNINLQANVVPEAGTVTLTGLGAAFLLGRRRRRSA